MVGANLHYEIWPQHNGILSLKSKTVIGNYDQDFALTGCPTNRLPDYIAIDFVGRMNLAPQTQLLFEIGNLSNRRYYDVGLQHTWQTRQSSANQPLVIAMRRAMTSPVTMPRRPQQSLLRAFALMMTILIANPAISGIAGAQTGPMNTPRIISTNICIDTLLVALADRKTITALSPLAADRRFSTIADKAAEIPSVKFTAEDIYRLKPTIVFVSNFASPRTRAALTKLGITVVTMDYARSIDDIKANIINGRNAWHQRQSFAVDYRA